MPTPQQEGNSTIPEAAWVTILGALAVVLGFLLGVGGLPDASAEIVLVDAVFVILVSILVYRIETHLDSNGYWTLFKGRAALGVVLAAVALGAIGGTLAELASSKDPPPTPAIVIYERQVQEVLGPLRRANADAFEKPESRTDPDLYAKNARELSQAYDEASEVLGGVESPRSGGDVPHYRLVARLKAVGEAYAHLGTAVAEGSPNVEAAEARVRGAIEELREAEEQLRSGGYRVTLTS